jgi:hypothetical protein
MFCTIGDRCAQWQVYNYQPGDVWAWLLNAGHEPLIVRTLVGFLAVTLAISVAVRWSILDKT